MTVPAPIVSRSVQIGTRREKITTPGPICAPSARRYSEYSGEPTNISAHGFDRTRVFTIQKRTYERLQMRIRAGFHRPMSIHFARIGKMHTPRKPAPLADTSRTYR